jgi:hypothetical protein
LPAPLKVQRCVKDIQKQKVVVEKEVSIANLVRQHQWHKEIHEILSQISLRPTPVTNLPCRIVPYAANPRFYGREDVLRELQANLAVSKPGQASFALYGLGGVGKTQIALKYIYDNLDRFPAVFWMQSDSHAKLSQSYVNAAKRLQLEPEDSQRDADAVAAVLKTWLGECHEQWLIAVTTTRRSGRPTPVGLMLTCLVGLSKSGNVSFQIGKCLD